MTEKNIFIYKLFLSLNISDFSLFFYIKTARSCQALHFLKIWSEDQSYPTSPPLSAEEWGVGGGGGAHDVQIHLSSVTNYIL